MGRSLKTIIADLPPDDRAWVEAKGREIFDQVLRVASGAHTKSEDLGYGDQEFVPWQIGAVM